MRPCLAAGLAGACVRSRSGALAFAKAASPAEWYTLPAAFSVSNSGPFSGSPRQGECPRSPTPGTNIPASQRGTHGMHFKPFLARARHGKVAVSMGQPAFLITIDTEGDNLWSDSRRITTRNSDFLPRFQQVCEAYGLKPTYLVNYEMARCPVFGRFARDTLRRSVAEIGCHIHAWNSPPDYALTADDLSCKPYLTEYPAEILWAKVTAQTTLLEQTFECPITSHRAGRWGFNGEYARALSHQGYLVDCSVTPGVSWKSSPGKSDGPDYSGAPLGPYFLDFDDVCRPGGSPLLEAPMTIMRLWPRADRLRAKLASGNVLRRALNRL